VSGVPNDLSYSLPQTSHWAIALLLSHLPQTSHYMGVYVLTVAESKPLVCSLYLESELPVKGNRGYIIHVYTQVESRKTQPVICKVHHQPARICLPGLKIAGR